METSVYGQLIALLRPLGWRLRLRSAVDLLARSAWMALAGCAVLLVVGRLFPLAHYRLAAACVLAAWLAGWAIYSLARPLRPFAVARRTDGELGLRDRIATALVLADPSRALPVGFDGALVSRQLADALATAQAVEPGRAFPPRLQRSALMRAAAALLLGAALLLLPNPMDAIVQQRAQVAAAARAEAEELERLAQAVEQNQALTPEDKAALLEEMRRLIEQLRASGGDAQKALADLAQFQERMRAALDPTAPAEEAALDLLAQQLAQLAGLPDTPADAGETADLLAQLAAELSQLAPEQRAALAGALSQAAARTMAGDPDLAGALADLAEAARADPSTAEAGSAAARARQALREAGERLARQQALAQAANQAGQGQQAIARAAGSSGQSQGQATAQGPGQGQGQPGGGGTNANTLPPGVRPGTAGAPTGPNKPYTTGDLETVYAAIASGEGDEEFVSGQQGAEGQTTTKENNTPLPGSDAPALVPYNQVYQQYRQVAGQAMERSYIPAGLREYVKEYFSALEP